MLPLYLQENSPAASTWQDNCNTASMGFLSGGKNEHQGRQINAYNIFVLLLLGFGSITYGYSASIIATTLGNAPSSPTQRRVRTYDLQDNRRFSSTTHWRLDQVG